MKIAGKIAIFAAGLSVIAAAIWFDACRSHAVEAHGKLGSTLEYRVAALDTEHFDQFNRAPDGFDVFSSTQARQIADSGQAPAGFKWMPVSRFYLMETGGGVEPRGILHTISGHKFLLVADRPEMALTHSADTPAWGVQSVKFTSTNRFGRPVYMLEVELDGTGGRLVKQFTQKYLRHSVAVIVDGRVVIDLGLLGPMGKVQGFNYPEGGEAIANELREALLK
ncbi:MAG: hypothetical protein ACLPZY_13515 [Terracidiphilus sp.]